MENERDDPEVIRHRMQETRTHLTNKVEAVEEMVTNTVKSTAEAVTETVDEVKEAVAGAVEGAKEVVHDTVAGVRSFFDINEHFRKHPWLMLAGVAGLSFLATKFVAHRGRRREDDAGAVDRVSPTSYAEMERGSGPGHTPAAATVNGAREHAKPRWLASLAEKLGPAATKLEEMGIGYTLGLIDHMVGEAVPEQLRGGVHDVIQTLTTSLGGKPLNQWPSGNGNGSGR
jgi:ElaB/YqjD/DUF883 family membrane-anchored ribosome-binding protein